METTKTNIEALAILARYWMREVEVTVEKGYRTWYTKPVFTCTINAHLLTDIKYYKSFQILLRSIDEMTEEEKDIVNEIYEKLGNCSGQEWELLAAHSIDYLRSIGVATSEDDRKLITIKN